MNDCFSGCSNLKVANLSNLDLTNNHCFMNFFKNDINLEQVTFPSTGFSQIYWYYRMFYNCESLTSIDMSLVSNSNGQYFYEMFYGCTKLQFIDLSSFGKEYNGYSNYNMFINVPKNAYIKINQAFYKGIKTQLNDFTNVTIA